MVVRKEGMMQTVNTRNVERRWKLMQRGSRGNERRSTAVANKQHLQGVFRILAIRHLGRLEVDNDLDYR